jgi:hypothetical protein
MCDQVDRELVPAWHRYFGAPGEAGGSGTNPAQQALDQHEVAV